MTCFKCLKPLDEHPVHGLHKQCFCDWFQVPESITEFALTPKTAGNSNDPLAHLNSSFFHGKFKKYSAELHEQGYIVKMGQAPYEDLPASEYLCNQLARQLGIRVPDFFLIKLDGQTLAFVSKNFMYDHFGANLIHLYHLMGTKAFTLEDILFVILEQTRDEKEVHRFLELCLFDALIGNHDRHGRNLAFIQTPKQILLSPFYDNPSYIAIEEEWLMKAILEPCGRIRTASSKDPKMAEYVQECSRLGYRSIAQKFAQKVDMNQIEATVHASFISPARKEGLLTLIRRRFQELQNEVSHE